MLSKFFFLDFPYTYIPYIEGMHVLRVQYSMKMKIPLLQDSECHRCSKEHHNAMKPLP